MSLTNQPAAFRDCYHLFDRAVATPGGVRMWVSKRIEDANYFQLRMNHARVILRNESKRVYALTDPLYDRSEYDGYQVQVRGPDDEGIFWIYVRPHGLPGVNERIEPISVSEPGVEKLDLSHNHQLQLTHEAVHEPVEQDTLD
jgi:hypothetical protein